MKSWTPTATDRTRLMAQVRNMLRPGRQSAIPGKELARHLGLSEDRAIRIVIRDLIADGVPVASATDNPAGYYIVANGSEAADYLGTLRNRIREDEGRYRDFEKATRTLEIPVQGAML